MSVLKLHSFSDEINLSCLHISSPNPFLKFPIQESEKLKLQMIVSHIFDQLQSTFYDLFQFKLWVLKKVLCSQIIFKIPSSLLCPVMVSVMMM